MGRVWVREQRDVDFLLYSWKERLDGFDDDLTIYTQAIDISSDEFPKALYVMFQVDLVIIWGRRECLLTLPSYDNDAKTQGSRELQARPVFVN